MLHPKVYEKINKIKSSKNATVLMSNFVSLSVLQIVSYVFPLFTLPYLSRIIGVEKFGELAYVISVIGFYEIFVDYGFNYTATRDVARCKNNKEELSYVFSCVIWSKIILLLFSFVIMVVFVCIIPKWYHMKTLFFFSFLSVIGRAFYPDWLFQGLERMKYMTIIGVFFRIIFTLLIFIFIKKESDYIYRPLCISFGICCGSLVSMYIIIFKWKLRLKAICISDIISTIRNSTDVFVSRLSDNLYLLVSVVILGSVHGSFANGIFDAGYKVSSICNRFLDILSRIIYPYFSRSIEKHRLLTICYLIISVIANLLLFVFAPILIELLYTPCFFDGIIVLRVLSISGIFMTISSMYGPNYLIVLGYEREFRNITIVCVFIGLLFAFPLIYYFSFIGVSILIVIVRVMLSVAYYFKAASVKKHIL